MSVEDDLEILKKFAGEPETQAAPDGEEAVSGALDLEDLIAPGEDEPASRAAPSIEDVETLKFKLQKAENALDEMRLKLSASEKAADELAFFRHPHFIKIKQHIQAGGQIYLTPIGLSQIGRDAMGRAVDQIKKIQTEADKQKSVPIFDVRINNISTQQRIPDGKS